MKQFAAVVASVLIVLTVIFAVKDTLIKIAVEKTVQHVVGLRLKMSELKFGILNPIVDIKNLKLYNPAGYQDRVLLDMPEIYVNYDLLSFFKGRVHLPEMKINLKKLVVVKNREGKLNLDALKFTKSDEKKKTERKKSNGALGLKIDTLKLKIDKAYYKDYSGGGSAVVKEFNVNVDETYSDIEDLTALVSLIVVKTLSRTTITSMASFEIYKLKNNIKDVLAHPSKIIPVEKVSEIKGTLKEVTSVFSGSLMTSSGGNSTIRQTD